MLDDGEHGRLKSTGVAPGLPHLYLTCMYTLCNHQRGCMCNHFFPRFPIRVDQGRISPYWAKSSLNRLRIRPKYVLKKFLKKLNFCKTHCFEAILNPKKNPNPYLKLSVSLVLSLSISPLSLSNTRLSHSLTQIPSISPLPHYPSSLFISQSHSLHLLVSSSSDQVPSSLRYFAFILTLHYTLTYSIAHSISVP